MVNIEGIDKAELLVELYNNAIKLGLGVLQPDVKLTVEDARELLEKHPVFDYLNGKVLKVDLSSDKEFDETLYDHDNGLGTAQFVVDTIRIKNAMDKAIRVDNNGDIHILDENKFNDIIKNLLSHESMVVLLSDKLMNTGYKNFYVIFLEDISYFNSRVEDCVRSKYSLDNLNMSFLTFNFSYVFSKDFYKQTLHNRKFITELFCTYANKAKETLIPLLNDGRMNQEQYNFFVNDLDKNIAYLEKLNQMFDEMSSTIYVVDNEKIEVKDENKLYELLDYPDGADYVNNYIVAGMKSPSFEVIHDCDYIFHLLGDIIDFLHIDIWQKETANALIGSLLAHLHSHSYDYVDIPSNISEFLVKLCVHYFELLKLKIDNLFNTNQISNDAYQAIIGNMDNLLASIQVNNDRIVR